MSTMIVIMTYIELYIISKCRVAIRVPVNLRPEGEVGRGSGCPKPPFIIPAAGRGLIEDCI